MSVLLNHWVRKLVAVPWGRWNDLTWFWLLVGVTAVSRLAYVLIVGKPTLGWGDELTYDQLAVNLLEHGCYCFLPGQPTVLRAPLYPWILAGLYSLFGHNYMVVLVLQALSAGLAAGLLALIGKHLTGAISVGVLAGLVFAFTPINVFATGLLYTETFYFSILFGVLYLWLRLAAWPKYAVGLIISSGLLLGLSVLLKPNLLYFPVFLLFWAGLVLGDLKRTILLLGGVTLGLAVVIAPWSWRNYTVLGEPVLVSANTGLNLLQGNHAQADGGALDVKFIDPLPDLTEVERDRAYFERGLSWIRENPGRFIALMPLKLYKFFSPLETSNRGGVTTSLAPLLWVGYIVYYSLAVIGFWYSWRVWRNWLLLYLLIAYPTLIAIVFYGGTRYGMAVQPFITLFAALAIVQITKQIGKPR